MHLFYTPDIEGAGYTLNEDESKHCVRVLRLTEGDAVSLIDGKGNFFDAKISEAHPKRCQLEIIDTKPEFGKRDCFVQLAIAPTKNMDRMEWMVEKCTEVGIDAVCLLECDHSERRSAKEDRLEKIAISSMKQSLKAYLPQIKPMVQFKEFVQKCATELKFIAHCDGPRSLLSHLYIKGKDVTILIGPEGDFSPKEVELAIKQGFVPISLGSSRLRTETAGLVAVHTVSLLNDL